MKTIPFDLEKAKAGAKFVSNNGNPARILDFNRKGCSNLPLIAVIEQEGRENIYTLDIFGKNGDLSLSIVVEPKYVPFTRKTIENFVGKPVKQKSTNDIFLIVGAYSIAVKLSCQEFIMPYNRLLDEYEFLDGTPCGALEE